MKPRHVHLRVALLNSQFTGDPNAALGTSPISLNSLNLKSNVGEKLPDEVAVLRYGDDPANLYWNVGLHGSWLEIEFSQSWLEIIAKRKPFRDSKGWQLSDIRVWIRGPGILQTIVISELDNDADIEEASTEVCDAVDSLFPLIRAILDHVWERKYLQETPAPFGIPTILSDEADFVEADEYQYEDHYFVPARCASTLDRYFENPAREIAGFQGHRLKMLTASVLWRAQDSGTAMAPDTRGLPILLRPSAILLAQFKIASQLPRIVVALLGRASRWQNDDPRLFRSLHAQYESMWLSVRQTQRKLGEGELIVASASASVGSLATETEEFRHAGESILSLAEGLEAKRAARDDHWIESLLLVVSAVTVCGFALDRFDFIYESRDPGPSPLERLSYLQWWVGLAFALMAVILAIRWRLPQRTLLGIGWIWRKLGISKAPRRVW